MIDPVVAPEGTDVGSSPVEGHGVLATRWCDRSTTCPPGEVLAKDTKVAGRIRCRSDQIDLAGSPAVVLPMDWRSRITFEPGKRGGKPCIRGLRITVTDVLEYLASGMSEDEILRDFPDLIREDIRACLAFAADRERKFVSVPPA